MEQRIDRRAFAIAAVALAVSRVARADAPPAGRDGFIHTGSATRIKSVAFIDVKVYDIQHFMKVLPGEKNREAIIAMHCDKRFTWKTRRDLPAEHIRQHLRHGFALNLYTDKAKIDQFLAGVGDALIPQGTRVLVDFDADTDATTLAIDKSAGSSVLGVDFMQAVWSLWFGHVEQPKLAEQLISKI